jgi:hypothetical protein
MRKIIWIIPAILSLVLLVAIAWAAKAKVSDIPPPDTSDLVPTRLAISDAENAYTYFVATNTLYWPNEDFHDNIGAFLYGRTNNDELVRETLTGNSETLTSIERGLLCQHCQSPETERTTDSLSYLGKWRSIGKLMALKAMYERQNGHCSESFETCMKLLKYGDLIQKDAESIVQYLLAVAVIEFGLEQTRQLTYTKRLSDIEVKALARQVAELSSPDRGLIRALKVEYICDANMIDDLQDGKLGTAGQARSEIDKLGFLVQRTSLHWMYLFQPSRTKKICVDFLRDTITNAPLPYAKMKLYDPDERFELAGSGYRMLAKPNMIGRMFCSMLLPNTGGILIRGCRTKCSITASKVILACEAYRQAVGELPPDIETLVPKYLDSVPLDPFDGAPIRYSKAKGIVYSVGIDLKDSGGSVKPAINAASMPSAGGRWQFEDAVFPLQTKTNATKNDLF